MSLAIIISPGWAIVFAWVVWVASWFAAALWSRRPEASARLADKAPNRIVTVAGALLIFMFMGPRHSYFAFAWDWPEPIRWALFACVLAGMAFAWWARLHLGVLWSGNVTRKPGHRVVDTGPYRLVRHPIYTDILFSLFATALERGHVEPVIGFVLMFIGFAMKARLEERFLAEGLGVEAYAQYRARVPMLVPFTKAPRAR